VARGRKSIGFDRHTFFIKEASVFAVVEIQFEGNQNFSDGAALADEVLQESGLIRVSLLTF